MQGRGGPAAIAGVLALLVLASPAEGGRFADYSGETSQGHKVEFGTDRGVPDFLLIYSYRAPCGDADAYREREAVFNPPFDLATRRKMVEEARYRRDGPRTGPVEATIVMHRTARHRWSGTFTADIRIQNQGKVLAHCHADYEFEVSRDR
jgi:hypothetical protein